MSKKKQIQIFGKDFSVKNSKKKKGFSKNIHGKQTNCTQT